MDTKTRKPGRVAVVICTDKRGVFFGWIDPAEIGATKCTLYDAQMAVYWSRDVHGVLGLAGAGPSAGCRISPPCKSITLDGVHGGVECSPEAVPRWESQPWG